MSPSIVIVGGGITGLSTAFALKQAVEKHRAPVECIVLEQSNRFGGKIQTTRESGFVMEGGPESMLARKPSGIGLIKALGIESEIVSTNPKSSKTYILKDGRLERLPLGTNMGIPMEFGPFASTPLLTWSQKVRVLYDLLAPRSDTTKDQSLGHFLRRRLGDGLVDNVIEPLLAGIYAGNVDDLSIQATFPQFQKLEDQYKSLIRGSIQQRKKAPASGPDESGRSAFITLRNGLESLIERLYDCLHEWADLRLSTTVLNIRRRADGKFVLAVEDRAGQTEMVADAVIVTTPAFAAADLLEHVVPQAQRLRTIPYASTATIMVAYPRHLIANPLDGAGYVIPHHEKRRITASTWVSSKWSHTAPQDHIMIRCYVGRSGDTENLLKSDDEIVSIVREELKDIHGITAAPILSRVTRWNDAMPQYRVNHLKLVEELDEAITALAPGVFVAGAGYRGLGIPDCIAQGEKAAARTLAHIRSESH